VDTLAPAGDIARNPGAAQTGHPAAQATASAVLQVQSRIIERFDGRAHRFEVRLDPAELGRVDVRIEIGADRKVHAILAAHDGAALNDLMRGSKALEQALSQAGIDLAEDGLSFQLASDNPRQDSRDPQAQSDFARRANLAGTTLMDLPVDADPRLPTYALRAYAYGRLNLVA
jgi:flagellar hook-length control protein FliK